MTVVTIHEAKTNLSKLIKLVEAGEEVVIARGKTHVARIVASQSQKVEQRVPGRWKNRISLPEDVLAPLTEEELLDWEGKYESPM
jgi:antitoxin (DNA-binding transcriptional repressor) of toxin-antitoxin stability system